MRTARWSEIDGLLQAALEMPADQRERFIDAECASDPELRNEVRSLLIRYDNESQGITSILNSASALLANSSEPDIPAGHRISKYQILSKLGRGGMGDVYLAEDLTLKRKVALKLLPAGVGEMTGTTQPVFYEARAASSLNHTNIITVFDAGEADGRQFIATEYVQGVTLRDRIVAGPIELKQALEIAVQVASALAAAHAAGVVHRDIKPENIMLRPDGVVKVLDFGIAKIRDPLSSSQVPGNTVAETINASPGVIIGSLPYMSPEQARGRRIDSRSDIFSFGALLFELVSGTPAFSGKSNLSTLLAVVSESPVMPGRPALRPALQKIVDRCLQKDPGERAQRIEDIKLALEDLQRRLASNLPRKWVAAGLTGAILAAAAGAAFWPARQMKALGSFVQTRLTHDGSYKEAVIAFNGSSIFFDKVDSWRRSTVRLSIDGNNQSAVAFAHSSEEDNFEVQDSVPGLNDILFRTWRKSKYGSGKFSVLHLPDGTLSDVPGILGYSGAWSPDGKRFAYFSEDPGSAASPQGPSLALFTADRKGSVTRVCGISDLPKPSTRAIAWSRDGTLWFMQNERLFEVLASGSNPQPVFDSEKVPQGPGKWTPDGELFVFSDIWTQDLWALSRSGDRSQPVRLTSGPLQFGTPVPSRDSLKMYAVGQLRRGRVTRYDRAKRSWSPLPDGLSADGLDYSPDGAKLAYVSYPEGELWVSDTNGGGRQQVTNAPMRAFSPHFSPDSRQIAFMGRLPGERWRIYLYSGSQPIRRMIAGAGTEAAPSWSPDGSKVIYAPFPWDVPAAQRRIFVHDIRSGVTQALPNSEGLFSPRWSPDGRYVSAMRFQRYGMNPAVLWDSKSEEVTELGVMGVYPDWSKDSQYLYLLSKSPLNPASVVEVSMKDRSIQTVARFEGRIVANSPLPSQESIWLGFTADESPLVLEDLGNREIYEIGPSNKQ